MAVAISECFVLWSATMNTVAVASRSALDIPVLRRQVARMPFPTGLRDGAQPARQFAGSAPFTLADSAQSPPPRRSRDGACAEELAFPAGLDPGNVI